MSVENERDTMAMEQTEEEAAPMSEVEQEPEPQIDPQMLNRLLERMRGEQNLILGIVGGAAGAAVGAALWTLITVLTNSQVGYMALGVGFLAGLGVRHLGNGVDKQFQYIGAGLSLAGCVVGNIGVMVVMISKETGMAAMEVMARLTPGIILELQKANFHIVDLLFYFLALSVGYKTALRKIPQEELNKLIRS